VKREERRGGREDGRREDGRRGVIIRPHDIIVVVFLLVRNAYHGVSPYCTALTALGTWNYQIPNAFGIHHVSVLASFPHHQNVV